MILSFDCWSSDLRYGLGASIAINEDGANGFDWAFVWHGRQYGTGRSWKKHCKEIWEARNRGFRRRRLLRLEES